MTQILESLEWRYATKKYSDKKISEPDFQILKESMRLSVSSMGLQPYKIIIVDDPKLREQLKDAAYNQSALTDASHVIVFANETHIGDEQVSNYMQNIAKTRDVKIGSLNGFNNSIRGFLKNLSPEETENWARFQTYIALGNLINSAALLKIDATPMEGFDIEKFNEILDLKSQNLSVSVIATIGYRHKDDAAQHLKKVRKSEQEIFITL